MSPPHYCRLYLDTGLDLAETRRRLEDEVQRTFPDLIVHAVASRNEGFEPSGGGAYDPIAASRWTVEIDSEIDPFDVFQAGVCRLIENLRTDGMIVTASCDFEDRVTAETGWNWTVSSPDPPG